MQDQVARARMTGLHAAIGCALLLTSTHAVADPAPPPQPAAGPTSPAPVEEVPLVPEPTSTTSIASPEGFRLNADISRAPPPPSHLVYFQYGVAFNSESVLSAGGICNAAGSPCILGSGGGITIRGGWRNSGSLYFGFAYEITKQDPNKLYRIALLQQARAEGRYYFTTARVTEPYLAASLGLSGYGNQWSIDTWGPGGSLGAGVEYQVSRTTVVGISLDYRLLWFSRFTDTAGTNRDPGVAQLLGLNLVLEQRTADLRAGKKD